MITGTVANREALVELEVANRGQTITTTAVIDTGYNGYLTLPLELITGLGLSFAGYRSGTRSPMEAPSFWMFTWER